MMAKKRRGRLQGVAFLLLLTFAVLLLRVTPAGAEDRIQSFVERMYTVALNRTAEPSGLQFWTEKLTSQEANGAMVADQFFNSDEFLGFGLNDEEYLSRLYRTFFDRTPDTNGFSYWLGNLTNHTVTRQEVLVNFVNSAEFSGICTDYGIRRGKMRIASDKSLSLIEQFTQRLYSCILERSAESSGMENWTNLIRSGSATPEDAAREFFLSDEYIGKNTSNEDFVEAMYFTFMDRDVTRQG